MNDPTIAALIIKAVLAMLLIIGGFVALFMGKNLYVRGVGLAVDGSQVEVNNVKASLKTVGSVVMATSVAWGWLGYLASPTLSSGEYGTGVAYLNIDNLDVRATALTANINELDGAYIKYDAVMLGKGFESAIDKLNSTSGKAITINNTSVPIGSNNFHIIQTGMKKNIIYNQVETDQGTIAVSYEPVVKGNELIFNPNIIGIVGVKG